MTEKVRNLPVEIKSAFDRWICEMPIDWWLIAFCIHAIAIAIAARASIKTPLGRGCTKVQRAIPVRGRRAAPGNGTFVLCVMERERVGCQ
jgi:hypothetical protein